MVLKFLFKSLVLLCYFDCGISSNNDDMQLEMISEKITDDDCKELVEMKSDKGSRKPGDQTKTAACFDDLKRWNENREGKKNSVEMTNELRKIGYEELAELTNQNLHGQADKIKKNFFGGKFKSKPSLEITKEESEQLSKKLRNTAFEEWIVTLIALISIVSLISLLYLLLKSCPFARSNRLKNAVRADISEV